MPAIRAVYGPHSTKVDRTEHAGRLLHARIKWAFTGIRDNGEFCRWTLIYYADSRQFRCRRNYACRGDDRRTSQAEMLLEAGKMADVPMTGQITPMLKAKLRDYDLASCIALSLELGR